MKTKPFSIDSGAGVHLIHLLVGLAQESSGNNYNKQKPLSGAF
jgi:hypothetical protein